MKKRLLLLTAGLASLTQLSEAQTTLNFTYTGTPNQTFVIPNCVNTITITTRGASGSAGAVGGPNLSVGGAGGFGALATGVLTVTPGATLFLNVGGAGGVGTGGFNGGGNSGTSNGGGGGGATDVRIGGSTLNDRVLVAGGGGGGGRGGCETPTLAVIGGAGGNGGANGSSGVNAPTTGGFAGAGAGGTGTLGGVAGIGCSGFLGGPGANGVLGIGGTGGTGQNCCCFTAPSVPAGGGGGGGYFGGGGGGGGSAGTAACQGNDKGAGGGGAGGTNFFSSAFTNTSITTTTVTGNGLITIAYSTFPNVSVSAVSNTVCANSPAILTASGATTYTWSNGASAASTTVTPAVNTVYTVTGTTSGCIDTKTIGITTLPSPTVSISPISPSGCIGSTVGLTASGATTYTWNTNAQTAGITATVTAGTNTFNVQGSGANGCKTTSTLSIGVLANPTVTAVSSSPTICVGSSATITANGASTYSWSNSSATSAITVSPATTTTYTVTGLGANGCSGSTTFVQNVSTCVGINELSRSNGDVSISPNPASKQITIKTSLNASTLSIINVAGQEVMKANFSNQEAELNILSLANGVYFVKVNESIFKFIKQ